MSPNWASTASLWIPKKIVAQGNASGAPIAFPTFCNQYVPPNWKTLFVMRSLNASIKTAGRKSRCFSFSRANHPMRWSDGTVLIFLYMEVASQINRRAFDGVFVCRFPFLTWINPENMISAFKREVEAIMWWADQKYAGYYCSMTRTGVSSPEPYAPWKGYTRNPWLLVWT